MRRMVNVNRVLFKPELYYEDDIKNDSSIIVSLEKGDYLIELHGQSSHNVAFLTVCEESYNISTTTLFNSNQPGTAFGAYQYNDRSNTLEITDFEENPIITNGHIDIYKF